MSTTQHINAAQLSLEEWVALVKRTDRLPMIPSCCFPSEEIQQQYLGDARNRPEEEIRAVLRFFLVKSSDSAFDQFKLAFLQEMARQDRERAKSLLGFEFYQRLISERTTWEGVTWVLDLLSIRPKLAIDAIWAYLLAHLHFLPDFWAYGLEDAIALIRARYIDYDHPNDIYFDLTARQFEVLIARLFSALGYEIELTPPGNDGGRDIIARCSDAGRREGVYIECKCWRSKVGRPVVQKLLGVVQTDNYSRAVIASASGFTKPAAEYAERTKQIELLDGYQIAKLLNEQFGSHWRLHIESLTRVENLVQNASKDDAPRIL